MEHIKQFEKRVGCDVGYGAKVNLRPVNDEGCVGVDGIDKTYTLIQMIELAYKMPEKPNILIKAGPNAKWYIKKYDPSVIDEEIEKQKSWRDISRCTMYVIEWDK
jgi:hypothetical protein